ncbi:predicted protein [Nematostella vectensis]|uniref:Uncharacterized protein n=1 Tax=Nematostella vectensis TaxID=45351 RepID=A7SQ26_NEMVE|nr:predicted protein [Nematostella vectensis]|eukprot:XP_001626290.1 predicted protein [Nematostella vectensis]
MTSYISSVKANFMSQVYIFAENGSYVWGDEETEVRKGSVKFNIKVEGWKFCGDQGYTCKEGVGSYLDSKICIASKKGSGRKMERKQNKAGERPKGPKGKAKAEKFFFAGDSIVMPRGVEVDGTGKDMPAGYPSVDSSNCFTVRFPKFNSYALYDPSVTLDDNEAPPSSDLRFDIDTIGVGYLPIIRRRLRIVPDTKAVRPLPRIPTSLSLVSLQASASYPYKPPRIPTSLSLVSLQAPPLYTYKPLPRIRASPSLVFLQAPPSYPYKPLPRAPTSPCLVSLQAPSYPYKPFPSIPTSLSLVSLQASPSYPYKPFP